MTSQIYKPWDKSLKLIDQHRHDQYMYALSFNNLHKLTLKINETKVDKPWTRGSHNQMPGYFKNNVYFGLK